MAEALMEKVRGRLVSFRVLVAVIVMLGTLLILLVYGSPTSGAEGPLYQDPSAPVADRVDDLLARMTLDEKIGQMTQVDHSYLNHDGSDIATYHLGSLLSGGGSGPNGAGGTAAEWADMYDEYQSIALTTRLEIPLIYGVDAVHGHNNVYGATVFPHNIGMGATRNTALVKEAQRVTALEVVGTGIDWTFAPAVSVPRDVRWGRTYEGYGETPALVSLMAGPAVNGFQGTDLSNPETILSTPKHYVGDGGTAWGTGDSGYMIDQGDARISEQELRDIHLAPYIDAINSGAGAIMISYSSWNGEKLHGHDYLINDVLRGELGFDGIILSDWGAHKQLDGSLNDQVRTAINAGIDMIMVPDDYRGFIAAVKEEVAAGNISQVRIDDAVSRILTKKFELNLFERPLTDRTYTANVGAAAHREVARQAVRESLVLLENNGVLPLAGSGEHKIVVSGKGADDIGIQSGGWTITWQGSSGDITPGTTILEGIQARVDPSVTVQHIPANQVRKRFSGDIGIAVIGEDPYAEGQGDDGELAIGMENARVVEEVCQKTTRCVVILLSGRPLIINDQLAAADAFVAAWLPGTEGQGVADVLFGDYDFTGKLPHTWPRDISQVPINEGDAVYDPLFPYGFGLSYGGN